MPLDNKPSEEEELEKRKKALLRLMKRKQVDDNDAEIVLPIPVG